jgi:hypothetical protein
MLSISLRPRIRSHVRPEFTHLWISRTTSVVTLWLAKIRQDCPLDWLFDTGSVFSGMFLIEAHHKPNGYITPILAQFYRVLHAQVEATLSSVECWMFQVRPNSHACR